MRPDTIKEKHGRQILFETGRLFNSVAVWRGPGQRVHIAGDRLEISSSVPYAGVHQYGYNKVPARPYVKFIESDRKRWSQILHYNLIKAMVLHGH